MPVLLHRAVRAIKKKGVDENKAWAFATSALQKAGELKKGSSELTAKGRRKRA